MNRLKSLFSMLWRTIPRKWRWHLLWLVSDRFVVAVTGVVLNGDELGRVRYIQDSTAAIAVYPGSGSVDEGPPDRTHHSFQFGCLIDSNSDNRTRNIICRKNRMLSHKYNSYLVGNNSGLLSIRKRIEVETL